MTQPVVLAGSPRRLSGGTVSYTNPALEVGGASVAAGMEMHVILKSNPASVTRVDIVAEDGAGSPVSLTFSAIDAIYNPGNGFPMLRGWKYKFTGTEVFPLSLTNADGGSAVYDCFVVSGQRATASTEGWVGAPKSISTSPIVAASIAATDADSLKICSFGTDGGSSYAPPSTPSSTVIVDGTTGPAGWCTTAYRGLAASGASGTTSFPLATADGGNVVSYAIRPAATAGGGTAAVAWFVA